VIIKASSPTSITPHHVHRFKVCFRVFAFLVDFSGKDPYTELSQKIMQNVGVFTKVTFFDGEDNVAIT